ncbi:MAG: hypothetical protein AAGC53_22380 [Actinomycetota bacterium]
MVTGDRNVLTILLNTKTRWEPGWTRVSTTTISGAPRIVLYRSSDGRLESRAFQSWGTAHGVNPDNVHDVGAGWTTTEPYTVGGQTFLFLLSEWTGAVQIRPIAGPGATDSAGAAVSIGTVLDPVFTNRWSSGWTTAEFFSVGGRTFLFLLKESNGVVHLHEMNGDGTAGDLIRTHDWSSGWTTAEFFSVGGRTFLFLLKESNGVVHLHEMNGDGTVGDLIQTYDWTSGWTTAQFYGANGMTSLLLHKTSSGAGHFHAMNTDGTVGARLDMDEPLPADEYRKLMTVSGRGQELMLDYFETQSAGRVNLDGSEVAGWLTYDGSWQELKASGRNGQITRGIETARKAGIDIDNFDQFVVLVNDGPNSGAAAAGVLGHPGRQSQEFLAHELLHGMNLSHSFSDDPTTKVASWEKDGEYDDPYDIMSALRSSGFGGVDWAQRGPNLNAFGRSMLGWLDDASIIDVETERLIAGDPTSYTIHGIEATSGPRVLRVREPGGQMLSIEHRPAVGWDRGVRPSPLIHEVRSAKYFGSEVDRRSWSRGWTGLTTYRAAGDTFMTLVKESDGSMSIRRLQPEGGFGEEVDRQTIESGWTTVESFVTAQTSYVFLLQETTGKVRIHRVTREGRLGDTVAEHDWSSGWTTAHFFHVGTTPFLLLLKRDTGRVHLHRMTANGTAGALVQTHDWSSGWTDAAVVSNGTSRHLALVKEASGDFHINKVLDDGTIGPLVHDRRIDAGVDTLQRLGTDPSRLLVGRSNVGGGGRFSIHPISPGGDLDETTHTKVWSSGWDLLRPFSTRAGWFLVAMKSGVGTAITVRQSSSVLLRERQPRRVRPPSDTAVIGDVDVAVVDRGATAEVTLVRRFIDGGPGPTR